MDRRILVHHTKLPLQAHPGRLWIGVSDDWRVRQQLADRVIPGRPPWRGSLGRDQSRKTTRVSIVAKVKWQRRSPLLHSFSFHFDESFRSVLTVRRRYVLGKNCSYIFSFRFEPHDPRKKKDRRSSPLNPSKHTRSRSTMSGLSYITWCQCQERKGETYMRGELKENPNGTKHGSGLDCKFLQSGHCSTFRLYLTNFVWLWTN